MTNSTQELDLFPVPSHPTTISSALDRSIPRPWPGITPSSITTLQEILRDNHERWHIFVNEKRFHNHAAHAQLALWALGADEPVLRAMYKHHCSYALAPIPSPEPITNSNWKSHLADERYYQAYLTFFTEELRAKGVDTVLEQFIFSDDANIVPGPNKEQPFMLNRYLAALLHPMIHTVYGLEFGLSGMFVEGLAQTAVHTPEGSSKTNSANIVSNTTGTNASGLVSHFGQALNLTKTTDAPSAEVHAFTVLTRILKDSRMELVQIPQAQVINTFEVITSNYGDVIREYVNQWSFNGPIENKVEELAWLNVLIYGIAGYSGPGEFNADFFHMHLVTSSLFLSTTVAHLNRRSQELVLRAYFIFCMTWYVGRGRPSIDIVKFYQDAKLSHPVPLGPQPTPHDGANPSADSPQAVTPNPMIAIVQSAIVHPNDHLPKLQRALSHYASVYGTRGRGYFTGTELEGAEFLDGSLFVRVAGLTADRMGWVREGKPPLEFWDTNGFFKTQDNDNSEQKL